MPPRKSRTGKTRSKTLKEKTARPSPRSKKLPAKKGRAPAEKTAVKCRGQEFSTRLSAALLLGMEKTRDARFLRALATVRGISLPEIEHAPGVSIWPEWLRVPRDILVHAICAAACNHPDVSERELEVVDKELQSQVKVKQPRLMFAVLSLVTEWVAWATWVAQHYSETSYQDLNPYTSTLFLPLEEMIEIWGPDACYAVGVLRLVYSGKVVRGELPTRLDPDWIRSVPVAKLIAEKMRAARDDRELANSLERMLGLAHERKGHPTDTDRHLFIRILYVRKRSEYRSDRAFCAALLNHLRALPFHLRKNITSPASFQKDLSASPGFRPTVPGIERSRRPLRGSAIGTLLHRVSPEAPVCFPP